MEARKEPELKPGRNLENQELGRKSSEKLRRGAAGSGEEQGRVEQPPEAKQLGRGAAGDRERLGQEIARQGSPG